MVSWAAEALELRHGAAEDPKGAISTPRHEEGMDAFVDALFRLRQRLDRTEELRSKIVQAKGRIERARKQAEFEAERVYNEAMQRRGATRTQSFTTAKEKDADASLDAFAQKRLAHQAERLASVAAEAKTVIDNAYWGLSSIREEVLSYYKNVQFVTHSIENQSEPLEETNR